MGGTTECPYMHELWEERQNVLTCTNYGRNDIMSLHARTMGGTTKYPYMPELWEERQNVLTCTNYERNDKMNSEVRMTGLKFSLELKREFCALHIDRTKILGT
jgi:hypothetical protein